MAFNDGYSQTEAVKALQRNSYYIINAVSAQTTVKSSAGFLHGILFTANNVSAVAAYDKAVSGSPTIALFPASAMASGPWYPLDVNFNNGLTISSGSANTVMTVVYQ